MMVPSRDRSFAGCDIAYTLPATTAATRPNPIANLVRFALSFQ